MSSPESQYIVVFDTETTGLPKSKIINQETLGLWPHIVQFSYIVYDITNMTIVKIFDKITQVPQEVIMDDFTTSIHKITNEVAHNSHETIHSVLDEFFRDINNKNVSTIIGHNISFDINMIKIELLRLICCPTTIEKSKYKKMLYEINYTNRTYCTMNKTINLCQIPVQRKDGSFYYKYPKLSELYQKLFNEEPSNLHNALNDILVTLRCYYMIVYENDILQLDDNLKAILNEKLNV